SRHRRSAPEDGAAPVLLRALLVVLRVAARARPHPLVGREPRVAVRTLLPPRGLLARRDRARLAHFRRRRFRAASFSTASPLGFRASFARRASASFTTASALGISRTRRRSSTDFTLISLSRARPIGERGSL